MNPNEFIRRMKRLGDELRRLPGDIAVLAADEFDQNFERQGFFGEAWKTSKRVEGYAARNKPAGSILINTGALRRSIKYSVSGNTIRFASNVEYAQIHNEGGTINHPGGTAYFVSKKRGKAVFVSNRVERRFKYRLPRTKPHDISILQRQFIGEHPKLDSEIDKLVNEVFNILR